jgi:hypothetical protein
MRWSGSEDGRECTRNNKRQKEKKRELVGCHDLGEGKGKGSEVKVEVVD